MRCNEVSDTKCFRYMDIFFFNDTATPEIYTLSLHDALPISLLGEVDDRVGLPLEEQVQEPLVVLSDADVVEIYPVAEIGRAHVELQSRQYLVCRLLLEKKEQEHIRPLLNSTHSNISYNSFVY